MLSRARLSSIGLAFLAFVSCASRSSDRSGSVRGSAQEASQAPLSYPPAPWRLLAWTELDRIVLWVSHILISYGDARANPVLRPVTWRPDTPAKRSRSEALALASRLAEEAGAHPERFEALAMQDSDDEVTRASGGSLGGVRAPQLPPAFLDALTTLRPGEVSKVVETELGFHILLRRSAPPHQEVEGRRVVIRYAGTNSTLGTAPSDRPRDQARALANAVAAQARDGARPFEALVDEYSDHADRAFGGDIGVWSTLAPGDMPREIEALSGLKIGEVSTPVDTLWGFQVFQRIEPSPRSHYAMTAVRLMFGPDLPREDPRSMQSVHDEAYALAGTLRRTPSAFADIQRQHGGAQSNQWDWGHGLPQLTETLERLHFGEIAPEPVALPFYFVIPMRLDPQLVAHAEPPVSHELPSRTDPDVEGLFRDGDPALLLRRVAEFARPELSTLLHLSVPEQSAFRSSLEVLQKDLQAATTADARAQSYQRSTERLHSTLSAASYSRVMDFVEREAARFALATL